MEEFFRQNYLLLTYSVEIMAAVTGLLLHKKYKHTAARYFIYFLIYTAFVDIIGGYPRLYDQFEFLNNFKGTVFESNHWWSTLFWKIGSVLFYSFYFYKILKSKLHSYILKYGSITFLISSIIYIATHWDVYFVSFFPFISIFGTVIIFFCVLFYFIEILQSNNILSFYKSLNFYISSVLLIWWIIITPLVFYDIYNTEADWDFIILKWQIYLFANIFMYSMFTFALLWCKPEND